MLLQSEIDLNSNVLFFDSMLGHFVKPSSETHAYGATKYAVTAITEGIRQELLAKNSRIKVTVSHLAGKYICTPLIGYQVPKVPNDNYNDQCFGFARLLARPW